MTPNEMAEQIRLRAERRLSMHGIENNDASNGIALDTVNFILSANPHGNPMNSDGGSTFEYWNEVREILMKQPSSGTIVGMVHHDSVTGISRCANLNRCFYTTRQ